MRALLVTFWIFANEYAGKGPNQKSDYYIVWLTLFATPLA